MGLPPSDAGATHVTRADPVPALAVTPVGAPGTVAGTTAPVAGDAVPAPTAFVAATVNVYEVPFANPPTVAFVAVAGTTPTVPPAAPTKRVTPKPGNGDPPFDTAAVHDTEA